MSKTAGITNDLAQKSGDPPGGVPGESPDDFRWDNIAGPHGTILPLNRIEHGFNMKFHFWFLGRKPIFAHLAPDARRQSSTLKIGGADAHPHAANGGGHSENGNKAGDFMYYSDSGKKKSLNDLVFSIDCVLIKKNRQF